MKNDVKDSLRQSKFLACGGDFAYDPREMSLATLKNLYPFENHFLELSGGLRLHYIDEGQGEPIVMVHGNPSWSILFRGLIGELRDSRRCVALDHIGCGLSDKPGDDAYDYTLERRVDDLEALIYSLDLGDNVTLALHDWGGMIGMGWAARHPERVRRLMLFNTAAFHKPPSKKFPIGLRLSRTWPIGPLLIRGCNAFSFAASHVCCKRRPMDKATRHAYRMPYDSWTNRIATLRFVQDIPLRPGERAYDLVSEIEKSLVKFRHTPTFMAWGLLDFVFDRHFLARWLEFLPDAEVHRFEDGGHYILEDAAEEIPPLARQFLDNHPIQA